VRSPEDLWKRDRLHEPLISLPPDEPTCRLFQQELQRRKVEWFTGLELNSQELVARYVAEGFGIGLVLLLPNAPTPPGTRILELSDFPKIPYGALWLGRISPLQDLVIKEIEEIARGMRACETPARKGRTATRARAKE
jgi:DNA-binding transcriptional LysR family regulator